MNCKKQIFSGVVSLFLSSCIVVPTTAEKQQYYDRCKMATKKLKLEPKIRKKYAPCDSKEFLSSDILGCLLVTGVVTSASFVISGSIVLVGNTIHWMEYKAGCKPKHNKSIMADT